MPSHIVSFCGSLGALLRNGQALVLSVGGERVRRTRPPKHGRAGLFFLQKEQDEARPDAGDLVPWLGRPTAPECSVVRSPRYRPPKATIRPEWSALQAQRREIDPTGDTAPGVPGHSERNVAQAPIRATIRLKCSALQAQRREMDPTGDTASGVPGHSKRNVVQAPIRATIRPEWSALRPNCHPRTAVAMGGMKKPKPPAAAGCRSGELRLGGSETKRPAQRNRCGG